MLDSLLNSLKSEVGENIRNQTNLPDDKLNGVFSILGDVAQQEVANQMIGGNLSTVMNLFSDKPNNDSANALQNNITSGAIGNISQKLGISPEVAGSIAGAAIPVLINMITKKNNETPDDDPSPLQEIFGGKESGIGGAIGNILGKIF